MDEINEHNHIPDSLKLVQQALDSFVEINYQTAIAMAVQYDSPSELVSHLKGKRFDIIRNNPLLDTVVLYYGDGREHYLWYSDLYDDISKEAFKAYNSFKGIAGEVNYNNYTEVLATVELVYFKDIVELISIERLLTTIEPQLADKKQATPKGKPLDKAQTATKDEPKIVKRSYKCKLSKEQYKLLVACVEKITLFRRPVKAREMKQLFQGELDGSLEVTNQKTLVYLLDMLRDKGYIADKWISIASRNQDFTSFSTSALIDSGKAIFR